MAHGFLYLTAIMDWHSRFVLSWRLSNTLYGEFCIEALEEALEREQFTGHLWTDILKEYDIRISKDGKGRWMDNLFIERLWHSLKYACAYLDTFQNFADAHRKIGSWIGY